MIHDTNLLRAADENGPAPSPVAADCPGEPTTLPEDALILMPVRNLVLFPGIVLPVSVGRARSIAAAQEAARAERAIGLLLQKDPSIEEPGPDELHAVGTSAAILRYVTAQDGTHHLVCQGQQRFRVHEFLPGHPFLAARVEWLEESWALSPEIEARTHQLRERALEALKLLPGAPDELQAAIQNVPSPQALADLVASFMDFKAEEKQELLETLDLARRMDRLLELLAYRIGVLKLSDEIGKQTRASLEERQREHVLREQMRTIQKELGEGDDRSAEIEELRVAIEAAGMLEEVHKQAMKELRRLERMPEAAAEHGMIRTYLDWLIELPWRLPEERPIDIGEARHILEEDHWGLEKVKRRILEHLAVLKLNPSGRSPILCFVGPPGVGKTSLGQSIARALGRPFQRLSLGGVHDESEIRGHRRTYVGALPGNIIQQIRKAGERNCVLMLDEMDKLGQSFHGDPSAALLEVLDPEQNSAFRDTYLGVPFDLSRVMFIGTANVLDQIPGPLRDRLEVIELPGYTEDDKLEIARRYLVPRQLRHNGLTPEQASIDDVAIRAIIRGYTRESGCRNLEREIGAVLRRVAMRIAEGETLRMRIGPEQIPEILGPRRFENEVAQRTSVPGVATGLAWTPTGGDILFVEASRVPGKGRLILTGHLGDVMKESAQAALSLVKGRAGELGLDPELFERSDIHVHVPAGAIPKDGPSAGVAMYVALVSLLTEQSIRPDVAMTGEISLRGLVLPVGGIKEKVVAAQRAGIRKVLLPARNRKDREEIPRSARDQLDLVWVERVEEAVAAALGDDVAAGREPAELA
jgi:ATP-dependent Lon protease